MCDKVLQGRSMCDWSEKGDPDDYCQTCWEATHHMWVPIFSAIRFDPTPAWRHGKFTIGRWFCSNVEFDEQVNANGHVEGAGNVSCPKCKCGCNLDNPDAHKHGTSVYCHGCKETYRLWMHCGYLVDVDTFHENTCESRAAAAFEFHSYGESDGYDRPEHFSPEY